MADIQLLRHFSPDINEDDNTRSIAVHDVTTGPVVITLNGRAVALLTNDDWSQAAVIHFHPDVKDGVDENGLHYPLPTVMSVDLR